ncbi:MAG: hypothetical protein HOQ44_25520, partial [Nocardia sp.]|nr:hypothetical protein [Nocardia sp.]
MLETADSVTRWRRRCVTVVRRTERIIDLNYVGLVVATVFFALSVSPSLLPRDWMFQGLISGINAAIGYGVGCLLEWLFRLWVRPRLTRIPSPPTWARYACKSAVLITAALSAGYMLVQSANWQREITALMGMEGTTTPAYLRTGGLSLTVGVLVVAGYRTARELILYLARELNRWVKIPRELAPAAGFLVLVLLVVTLFNGVLSRAFFAA